MTGVVGRARVYGVRARESVKSLICLSRGNLFFMVSLTFTFNPSLNQVFSENLSISREIIIFCGKNISGGKKKYI